jgi:translation initiation factor 1
MNPDSDEKPAPAPVVKTSKRGQNTNRGRVDIVRQTAHRGGKAVTVAKNFVGIALSEKQELAKKMQKACGVGGTVKDGCIEIQGDKREQMMRILIEAGFKPVFAGG